MAPRAITFAVQLGSGGFIIARAVAEALGYHYYDWEVTSQAAIDAGVSPEVVAGAERVPSRVERLVERFLAANAYAAEEIGPTAARMSTAIQVLTRDDYRQFIESVVKNLAARGEALIVGHAGQMVLQKDPGVLKVFICGSRERRAKRLLEEESVSMEQAMATASRSDKERHDFFKHFYNADLTDASLYDITINTDHIAVEEAEKIVLEAAKAAPNLG